MTSILKQLWSIRVLLIIVLTPIILLPLPLHIGTQEAKGAYVLVVMAVYWITEAIPISVTALLPVFMYPMLGVIKAKDIAPVYMSDTIMMLFGGLFVAVAIEIWNIHKILALRILLVVGTNPRWLILGIMFSTWFLSIWIGNAATAAMMMPVAQAILSQLKGANIKQYEKVKKFRQEKGSELKGIDLTGNYHTVQKRNEEITSANDPEDHHKRMCKAVSICIAYSANIGGICNITGTAPNLVVKGHLDEVYAKYGEDSPINFTSWMTFALPLGFCIFIICWIWLQIYFLRCRGLCSFCEDNNDSSTEKAMRVKQVIRHQYDALGPITYAQRSVLVLFIILVVCWISRDLGGVGGWGDLFEKGYTRDSTPAILISVMLFFLPSEKPKIFCYNNKYEESITTSRPLLLWKEVHDRVHWSLFLLLGGGFALAKGCEVSGLSLWIGLQLEVFKDLNPWLMLLILCYICSFLTEITSNTAVTTIVMPIFSSLAISTGVSPIFYTLPAAISTSFAYMLPVATPPNALVFSYGHLKVIDMASAGFILNLLTVPLLVFACYTWGNAMFDFLTLPSGFASNATTIFNVTSI